MQIQISWLLKKPTDLDLHCSQRQGTSGFSRTRANFTKLNKDDNSHSSGACFHILVCRCDRDFNEVLYFLSFTCKLLKELSSLDARMN